MSRRSAMNRNINGSPSGVESSFRYVSNPQRQPPSMLFNARDVRLKLVWIQLLKIGNYEWNRLLVGTHLPRSKEGRKYASNSIPKLVFWSKLHRMTVDKLRVTRQSHREQKIPNSLIWFQRSAVRNLIKDFGAEDTLTAGPKN